jgi:hypothetical protein
MSTHPQPKDASQGDRKPVTLPALAEMRPGESRS